MFLSTFFLYTFDFVLAYSQLTMLWQFQVSSKRTQPYMSCFCSFLMLAGRTMYIIFDHSDDQWMSIVGIDLDDNRKEGEGPVDPVPGVWCCFVFQAISSLSNPGESRMPPKESKEIQSWISSKSVLHPGAQENTSLWATSPPSWCPSWEASTCGSILSVLTINSLISPGNGRTNVLLYASFLL